MLGDQKCATIIGIVGDQDVRLRPSDKVLDLGCGSGAVVRAFREAGYDAWGCDFTPKGELAEAGLIRQISRQPYRLPFGDGEMKLIISTQVFEHVRNTQETIAEIHRVLKPQGVSLHLFPSRYRLVEGHIKVPMAGVWQSWWWLKLWAALGVRNRRQKLLSARETAQRNYEFLHAKTNYLDKRSLLREFSRFFPETRFVEDSFLRHSAKGRKAYYISRAIPFFPYLYGTLKARVVYSRKSSA